LSASPFPLAIGATLALLLLVGERWPRGVAPGSSLAPAGLVTTACFALLVTLSVRQQWQKREPRRFSLILCGVTSLMAWPVWTMGVLPSINGVHLGAVHETAMRLERTTTSSASKSRRIYYWAVLSPAAHNSPLGAGRYFIPQERHEAWTQMGEGVVKVQHARGLLGAETVLGFR
jgi:hypothetical protein